MIKRTVPILILFLLFSVKSGEAQTDTQPAAQNIGREQALSQMIYQQGVAEPPSGLSRLQFRRNPFIPKLPIKPEENIVISPQPPEDAQPQISQSTPDTFSAPTQQVPAITVPEVTISGLVWNSDRPQAIINGRVMDIGDSILENAVITAINKDGIEISIQGQSLVIKSGLSSPGHYVQPQDMRN
jgi:hypothetical protein